MVLYACGIVGMMLVAGLPFMKALTGSLAFVPGDLVKAGVAALAARAVQAGYPLLPVRS